MDLVRNFCNFYSVDKESEKIITRMVNVERKKLDDEIYDLINDLPQVKKDQVLSGIINEFKSNL